jgi:hypothetical protein
MAKGKMGKGEMAKIGGEMAKGELGKGEMGINRGKPYGTVKITVRFLQSILLRCDIYDFFRFFTVRFTAKIGNCTLKTVLEIAL